MLTVTEPIKLKLNSDFVNEGRGFAERITGKYRLMSVMMFPEDLVNLVTQAPEVFMMGGDGGSFISQTDVQNIQVQKVDVINNMINRIMLSADSELTYQDRTYISTVLNKLGIKDDRKFMEQVLRLTEETRETRNLLHTYEDNRETLVSMINDYKISQAGERTDIHNRRTSENEILSLHESVNRRWRAGDDIHILQSFIDEGSSSVTVNASSYQLSELNNSYENIRINELRSEVRGERVPLTYHQENIYEGADITTNELTEAQIDERINSAVLLNMAVGTYRSVYENNISRKDRWYNVTPTFYRAGDVTLHRMESNTAYLQTLYDRDQMSLTVNNDYSREQEILQTLIDRSSVGDEVSVNRQEGDRIFEQADITYNAGEVTEETVNEADTRNTIEQQLYQINRQNEIRQKQYMQNLQSLVEEYRSEIKAPDEEQIRRETFLAFEHPEIYLEQYQKEAEREQKREREFEEKAMELLPPESRYVVNAIAEYLENPGEYSGGPVISVNNETLLAYDSYTDQEQTLINVDEKNQFTQEQKEKILSILQPAGALPPEEVSDRRDDFAEIIHLQNNIENTETTASENTDNTSYFRTEEDNRTIINLQQDQIKAIYEAIPAASAGRGPALRDDFGELIDLEEAGTAVEEIVTETEESLLRETSLNVQNIVRDRISVQTGYARGENITEETEEIRPGRYELVLRHREGDTLISEEQITDTDEFNIQETSGTVENLIRDRIREMTRFGRGENITGEIEETRPGSYELMLRHIEGDRIISEEQISEINERNIEETSVTVEHMIRDRIREVTRFRPGENITGITEEMEPGRSETVLRHLEGDTLITKEQIAGISEQTIEETARTAEHTIRDRIREVTRLESGASASEVSEETEPGRYELLLRHREGDTLISEEQIADINERTVEQTAQTVEHTIRDRIREVTRYQRGEDIRGESEETVSGSYELILRHREGDTLVSEEQIAEINEQVLRRSERTVTEVISDRVREIEQGTTGSSGGAGGDESQEDFVTRKASVRMVHRTQENTLDEETIENLRQEIRRVESDTKRTTERVVNNETVENRVISNTTTQQITEENERQIAMLVGDNIRSSINDISERVYSKIERQLQSERRRRGL